jgi:hypothetical protein
VSQSPVSAKLKETLGKKSNSLWIKKGGEGVERVGFLLVGVLSEIIKSTEQRKENIMNTKKEIIVSFAAAITFLLLIVAVPAGADLACKNNLKLYGEYAAAFTLNCGTCTKDFYKSVPYSPVCPADALTSAHTWNAQGVYTFDGYGGVKFIGRYLAVGRDPLPVPPYGTMPVVLTTKMECLDGTYKVNDDLTMEVGFEVCSVYLADGSKAHDIKNVNMRGRLQYYSFYSLEGPVLLLTDTLDPGLAIPMANIETVTNPLSTTKQDSYRICGLTGTAIKIKGNLIRERSR